MSELTTLSLATLLARPVQITKTKGSICATDSIKTNVLSEDAWSSRNYLSSERNKRLKRQAASTDKIDILQNRLLFTSARTDRRTLQRVHQVVIKTANQRRRTDRQTTGRPYTYIRNTNAQSGHRSVLVSDSSRRANDQRNTIKQLQPKKVADPQEVVGGDQPLPSPSQSE